MFTLFIDREQWFFVSKPLILLNVINLKAEDIYS